MDCERFDRDVVDLLYGDGELDDREALATHAQTCARCERTLATLRGAREAAARLPRVPVPEGLSARVLAAAAVPAPPPPLSRRVARAASWAGSLAMRPQLAMAALFCLAVGSSLLLLRARSDSLPGPTSVREEGLPSQEPAAQAPSPVAARATARPEGQRSIEKPEGGEKAGAPADGVAPPPAEAAAEASPAPAASAASAATADAPADAQAALDAALGALARGGCDAAVPALRSLAKGHPGTSQAERAAKEVAACAEAVAAKKAGPSPATGSPAAPPAGGAAPPGKATAAPP